MGVTATWAADAPALAAKLPTLQGAAQGQLSPGQNHPIPYRPTLDALASASHEIAAFAYLSRGGRLLGTQMAGSSLPDLVALPIRRIVRQAILLDACGLVMAHNHPSGIARPSRADIDTTRRLSRALALFDVRLVDHWIVTRDDRVSLRALGLM